MFEEVDSPGLPVQPEARNGVIGHQRGWRWNPEVLSQNYQSWCIILLTCMHSTMTIIMTTSSPSTNLVERDSAAHDGSKKHWELVIKIQ